MQTTASAEAGILTVVRSAAADLLARSEELSAALAEQIAAEVPELAADPVLVDALARSVLENVREVTARLTQGELVPDGLVPPAALDYARRLAERGIPASALLRAYRLGQAHAQEQVTQRLAESGADPAVVIAATATLSAAAFAYVDGISERVARAHEEARLAWTEGVAHSRAELVSALLAGRGEHAQLLARQLGYTLDQDHVAVVAWSDAADLGAPASGRGGTLVVPVDSTTLWAWLPARGSGAADPGTLLGAADGWVVASESASGSQGFVGSHDQARRVQALVGALAPPERPRLTRAADVRLPLLLAQDQAATATWVARTLGALATDDSAGARLRETLRTFFDEGCSFSAAAHRLGVHRNTVLYRVRSAERVLGHSLRDQRVEVEAALLATRWLGPAVLSRPAQR